jgi:hypothetical protein
MNNSGDRGTVQDSAKSKKFVEGVHFYYNDEGLMVLTEFYHKSRGHCCESGCLHCPYGFEK